MSQSILNKLQNREDLYFVSTFFLDSENVGEYWFTDYNLNTAIKRGREIKKDIGADWVRTEEVTREKYLSIN